MSTTDTTHDERELIFASFEDSAMGAVAEKALREWERQVESITIGNVAVVSRDAEGEGRCAVRDKVDPQDLSRQQRQDQADHGEAKR